MDSVLKIGRRASHGHYVGGKESPTWTSWRSMKTRCSKGHHYWYKGIRVCKRWQKSFAAFLSDMGNRPSRLHTIDRIDGTKGYEPGNCRWADKKQQGRNQKSNRYITALGQRLLLTEWAEKTGLSKCLIRSRIVRGWSVDEALSIPAGSADRERANKAARARSQPITANGETLPLAEWAERLGTIHTTIHNRIRNGWTPEKAVTTPVEIQERIIKALGRRMKLTEWANESGIDIRLIQIRLDKLGWLPDEAVSKAPSYDLTERQITAQRSRRRVIEADGMKLSIIEWAERLGTTAAIIRQRIDKYGWPPADAVTLPVGSKRPRATCLPNPS